MNLKAEASKSYLNYVWWVLEPALFIAVYYVVFGVFMDNGADNFAAFLICGKIPFLWFSRTVSNGANALIGGTGLMNQIDIPKMFFPLTIICQDLVKTFFVFMLMLGIMWAIGYQPVIEWFAIFIICVIQLLLVSGIALIFCALVPFLPDLKFIVGTFVIIMMFASGIFYDPGQVLLQEHIDLFFLNPLATVIDAYRVVIMQGSYPDWERLGVTAAISFALFIIGFSLIRIFDRIYPRLVLQ